MMVSVMPVWSGQKTWTWLRGRVVLGGAAAADGHENGRAGGRGSSGPGVGAGEGNCQGGGVGGGEDAGHRDVPLVVHGTGEAGCYICAAHREHVTSSAAT